MIKNSLIMGVVNLTPDSFSDGGVFNNLAAAKSQIDKLVADGADIIDLGAESSRPGSDVVSAIDEWNRLKPVLEILDRWPNVKFSLDSYKEDVILKALDYKIDMINNIKGLVSDSCLRKISARGLSYVSMHITGNPKDMQNNPMTGSSAAEIVFEKLKNDHEKLLSLGFDADDVFLDPGIGFGKDDSANLSLISKSMEEANNLPLLVGISRKSFLGRLLGIDDPLDRDPPSKTLELSLLMSGVKIIRTHEVKRLANMRTLLIN